MNDSTAAAPPSSLEPDLTHSQSTIELGREGKTLSTDAPPEEAGQIPSSSPKASQLSDPKRIGDHEILGEIARGGMGIVYRARKEGLNRLVALKVIRPDRFGRAENLARFQEEAEAIASLEHPNIVPLYEIGQWGTTRFFTMRLMEGGSLTARVRELKKNPRDCARVLLEVARALHHAHRLGILHLDLKPSNILLDPSGRPHLADFGLAQRFKPDDFHDEEHGVIGTPEFMSPEQADPKGMRLTTATDIYGLGAILYVLLVGKPPHQGSSTVDTMKRIREGAPRAPHELASDTDPDLEAICLKCLQKDPSRRYSSANELADDLQRFLDGRPVQARARTVRLVARKWARRHPLQASLVGLLIVTGLVAATAVTVAWRIAAHEADIARRRDYSGRILLAGRELDSANLEAVRRQLRETRARDGVDLRGFEWHYLDRQVGLERRRLTGHRLNAPYALAYDPTGRRIASAGADQMILIHDAATGRQLQSIPHESAVRGLEFLSEDRLAIGHTHGQLELLDTSTGKTSLSVRAHESAILGLAVSRDRRRLATAAEDGEVKLWDADRGELLTTFRGHQGAVLSAAFSPSGERLVTVGLDRLVHVWDVATGRELARARGHAGPVTAVDFSPRGDRFATADDAGMVLLWTAESPQLIRALADRSPETQALAFSPGGETLAVAGGDQTVSLFSLDQDSPARVLRGHTDMVFDLSFDPSGRHIASASRDQTVRIWDLGRDGKARILEQAGGPLYAMAVDPGGAWLATGGADGLVRVRPAGALGERRSLDDHGGKSIESLAVTADGRWLASADSVGRIIIRDVATGTRRTELRGHSKSIEQIVFSPDGTRLGSIGAEGAVRFWDWRARRILWTHQSGRPPGHALAFTPDGAGLLVGSEDPGLVILDTATGRRERVLDTSGEGIYRLAVSGDGRLVAGVIGRAIRVWNLRDGRVRGDLSGHKDLIYGLDFSPDGARLASSSLDQTIRLWELTLGQELLTLRGHDGRVLTVQFWDRGSSLLSTGDDGTQRIWESRSPTPDRASGE